ncbi:MAG: HSP20 family protein [Saprospiraceae bacterium]|jgi:HSP20 family protein
MNCNTQYSVRPKRARVNYPHFGNFVNEFFNTAVGDVVQKSERKNFTKPATNVINFDDRHVIELAIPGFIKKDVSITFEEDRLTIKSNREEAKSEVNYRLREFTYTDFTKSFKIPETVDSESIVASFESGILTITLNKKPEAAPQSPKSISIR